MSTKRYILLALMLVLGLILVACGGTPDPTPAATPAPAAPSDDTAAPPPPPAAATEFLRIWADDTRAPILVQLGDAFEAEYGVALVVEQVADIRDQFVIAAPAGEGPDILIGAHDWIGQLAASGLLAPIDLGPKDGDFLDVAKTAFTIDGNLYGMPYAIENLAFFRNTDLAPDAPATWDEVVQVGNDLRDAGITTYGFALTGTTYDAFPLQTSFGGYIFGRDAAGNYNPADLGVDSPGMIAAGEWLVERIDEGFMPDSTDWDTAHVLFETGETPFLMAGPWALDRISGSGVPFAISKFPGNGQPFLGVQGFMINALSPRTLLAQAFLTEFVATTDVMTQLQEAGNRPSAYSPVFDAITDANLLAFGEAGENAIPMPAIPEMGAVWGSWDDAFTLIINGSSTPEGALANAGAQIRELIGGKYDGMVNVPGSWQAAAGCPGDWQPDCEVTFLTDNGDGTFSGTFEIPAGDYEGKVAWDGSWARNYGVGGALDGPNYEFTMEADGEITFTYDSSTNLLTIETN